MTKPASRILALPSVRLLPITILAMAALLVVKSTSLVRAASAGTAAEAATAPAMTTAPPKKIDVPAPSPSLPEKPPADPPISDSERSLLMDLRQRRIALDAREAALSAREATLAAVDHRLSVRVDELTALQKRLEDLERQRKDRDEANWAGLVKLYETMKPRDAAAIFNDLDMPVLLPLLDRMKEAKAAPVLAAMVPERARQATAELAQMRLKANSIDGGAAPRPGG